MSVQEVEKPGRKIVLSGRFNLFLREYLLRHVDFDTEHWLSRLRPSSRPPDSLLYLFFPFCSTYLENFSSTPPSPETSTPLVAAAADASALHPRPPLLQIGCDCSRPAAATDLLHTAYGRTGLYLGWKCRRSTLVTGKLLRHPRAVFFSRPLSALRIAHN